MSITIAGLTINGSAALAPMAGVADRAFREICVEFGACYVVGEMVSSKGLSMDDKKSAELLFLSPCERPAAVQLFGNSPEIMAAAALKTLRFEPDIIDINMGCPAPKIASHSGGSSLMKTPRLARDITAAVANAVQKPVTVKMRTGWDNESLNAPYLARLCEEAGAAAVTVHGRTKAQGYAPPVNLSAIAEVRRAIKIPVIGNGDVADGQSAKRMLEETGCELVMVGRAALGRPWVFAQINEYLKSGTVLPEPPVEERMSVMLRHVKRICEYKGDYIGIREARKHISWYIRGIRGAASLRNETGSICTTRELELLAEKVVSAGRCEEL